MGGSSASMRTVSIALGAYDRNRALVIDPQLVHSTFLGGSAGLANAIAVDSSSNIYITGSTPSADFPTTSGAFQTARKSAAGFSNAFVTELDPNGQLLYSTYLGGDGICRYCPAAVGDAGCGIAVNAQGQIYVGGFTPSLNFPVTANAFQKFSGPTVLGASSGFVTVLDPTQTGTAQLIYSSYLGGNGVDYVSAIAVDSNGLAYVTGDANSCNFPVTARVFEPLKAAPTGIPNAFVSILNPALSGAASLVYSSYLGGSGGEDGNGVGVNSSGEVYVTGDTASDDFPSTSNAFEPSPPDLFAITGFVTIINPANTGASQLAYSTHLGGSFVDSGAGIAVDSQNRAYVTGFARSADFPVTSNAFQTMSKALITPFVSVIDPTQTGSASLVYSTFLGGSGVDGVDGEGRGIAVDSQGLAYVTGFTFSRNFPIASNFLQSANAGADDAFVSVLDASMSGAASLVFSSYLGGSGDDAGSGIAVDSQQLVYVAGNTVSANFPVTSDAFIATKPGPYSAFVAVLSPSDPPPGANSSPTPSPTPTPTPTPKPKPTPTPKKAASPTATPRRTPTPRATPKGI